MTEEQQYELGAYVNLMNSSTQLLVNPIMGLQPKFTEVDLENYAKEHQPITDEKKKQIIVLLSNLLLKLRWTIRIRNFYGSPSKEIRNSLNRLEWERKSLIIQS